MIQNGMPDQAPYEIDDFSGGITDYYIGGPKNAAQYMENLVLTPHRKITTRDGLNYFVDEQVNASATRIHLVNHVEEPLILQARTAWRKSSATAWAQIYGPNNGGSTDPAMADSSVSSSSIVSHAPWRGHTLMTTDDIVKPQVFYKDSGGTWRVRNAGLPEPASLSGSAGSAGTTYTYIYAVVYMYEYTVGAQTFQMRSAPFLATAQAANAIASGAANTMTMTLPTATGLGENYAVTAISQELYRTINNGKDLYLVTTAAYNTSSYADVMTDATLQLQAPLYTNGGVRPYDAPPKCKFLHVVGETAFYAYLKDSTGTYAYQVRQSIPGNVFGVPEDFNLDMKEAVTGISSHNGRPIVMCTNEVHRVEGGFDHFGSGALVSTQISPSAGCLSNQSIVQTPFGIFWWGNDGVYHTEGYQVSKITPHLDLTYASLTDNATKRKRVQGCYHPDLQAVVWTCSRDDGDNECDSILVLDLRWGLRQGALGEKQTPATFYFWNLNEAQVSGVQFIDRQLHVALADGYLFYLDSTKTYDLKFAATGDPSTWSQATLLYKWTSCATDFGTQFYRKWVPWFMVACTSDSNLSLQVTSIVDNGKSTQALKPIRYRGNIIWGLADLFWGSTGILWNRSGSMDYKRRVPKNGLRSMHRQVQLENALVAVISSDTMGEVNVNSSLNTATLNGTLTWPSEFVDYVIAFDNDGYVREFDITGLSTNTLTFADPDGFSPTTGSYEFVVRGRPKGETLNLNGLQMWWQLISRTQQAFATSQTGEPGAD